MPQCGVACTVLLRWTLADSNIILQRNNLSSAFLASSVRNGETVTFNTKLIVVSTTLADDERTAYF